MNARIRTFHSSTGDCTFLLLTEGERRFSVMVDCGLFEEPIAQFVREELEWKIDLLIVTHIDNDHITGVTDMLEKQHVEVRRIVFNCYQRTGNGDLKKLTKYQKERFAEIEREIGLIVGDIVEHNVGANDAVTGLAATILKKPSLKEKWDIDYSVSGKKIDLGEWGVITFLSPTMKEIERLDQKFRHVLFDELNVDQTMGQWDKQENLYEILLRYAMLQQGEEAEEKDAAGVDTLEERLQNAAKRPAHTEKITAENQASLAFVWEKGDHKILILGDANPDVVVAGLIDHYKNKAFPVVFDAIKVAHHGSHYNTTAELMRHADSSHFFFTGGTEGKRPSEEALGRIALWSLPDGVAKRTLHFNYETSLVEELKGDKTLQEKYHFSIDTRKNELRFPI